MNRKNSLLIDEPPLQVLPSLAKIIGLNEAIVLQQIHYWITNPSVGVERDGYKWVYNTYEEWKDTNFPFWSVPTIKRVFASLEKSGLVVSVQFESKDWNHKKFYRIDYDVLSNESERYDRSYQNDLIEELESILSLNTEITSETTSEKIPAAFASDPVSGLLYDPDDIDGADAVETFEKEPETPSGLSADAYKTRIAAAIERGARKHAADKFDVSGYPEPIQETLKVFVESWNVDVPGGKRPSPDWIKSGRELLEATGEFGVDLLRLYADRFADETRKTGDYPFVVSRPGSLVNPIRAYAAEIRTTGNIEPGRRGERGNRAPIQFGRGSSG